MSRPSAAVTWEYELIIIINCHHIQLTRHTWWLISDEKRPLRIQKKPLWNDHLPSLSTIFLPLKKKPQL